jgi:hypothetical protein
MRQRADDGDGILVLGNDGAAFEQCLEAGDPLVRQSERFNSVRFLTLPASR